MRPTILLATPAPLASPALLCAALRNMAAHPVAWEDARVTLSRLAGREVYLGGDGLRPYVTFSDGRCRRVVGVEHAGLPEPPLVAAVRAGEFGTPSRWPTGHREVYSLSVPDTVELAVRLSVPRVLLVGLGDADRYRGARLPLGIARLAQWLRYTGCHARRTRRHPTRTGHGIHGPANPDRAATLAAATTNHTT